MLPRGPTPDQSAFKYTLKDGSPVCYLRPIQNPAGRCHFSFPLYRHGGEHGQLLSLEEVVKRGLRQDEDSAYTPVRPDEYNLTEEEEEEALDRMRRTEDEEGWEGEEEEDGSDSSVEGKEREGGAEEGEEEEEDVEAVVNSYGRQALGCMFGMSHMPTMCSSYPLANEQSWADFWYSRSGGHGAAAEALTQQLEHQLSGTEEQEEGAAAAAAEEVSRRLGGRSGQRVVRSASGLMRSVRVLPGRGRWCAVAVSGEVRAGQGRRLRGLHAPAAGPAAAAAEGAGEGAGQPGGGRAGGRGEEGPAAQGQGGHGPH